MHMRTRNAALICALLLARVIAFGAERTRIDLTGQWRFAIDPVRTGVQSKWNEPGVPLQYWAPVMVPHCWPVDPRYPFYIGAAWYRRSFTVPEDAAGRHMRLVFEAVFYRARVWLNGRLLGEHEGGFTPFEFDVTPYVSRGRENTLAVEVDNSWSTHTLPGARTGTQPFHQVYHFWDYGGIVQNTYLEISEPVYIQKQKVVATPDLKNGTAQVAATVWAFNATDASVRAKIGLDIQREGSEQILAGWQREPALAAEATIPARSASAVKLETTLARGDVQLWDQDHPRLYRARAYVLGSAAPKAAGLNDTHVALFGIRKIEIAGTQLLLNGEPIRMGGAHRVSDHPVFGSIDPPDVVAADMTAMKTANMELARLIQHPVRENLLDWADRNGFLIVEEAGNLFLTAADMDSTEIRAKFMSQMREMVERDWNHPSVIGWSLGNEYESDTPSGVRWTRDMYAFSKKLDPTHLVTFVGNRSYVRSIKKPEDEGSNYVDVIGENLYGTIEECEKRLDLVHSRWPDKPIFVSEFGKRLWREQDAARQKDDKANVFSGFSKPINLIDNESEREEYFRRLISMIRSRHGFVVGASVWTYNDYRSRWPDTSPDGIRHFGLVTRDRTPRGSYEVLRQEFSPVLITEVKNDVGNGRLTTSVRVQARPDFPAYTLRDYQVRYSLLDSSGHAIGQESKGLRTLRAGEAADLRFGPLPAGSARQIKIEVVRPTGFVATDRTIPARSSK